MFDRKYKEALKIINQEIELYDGLHNAVMSFANSDGDPYSKEAYIEIADSFLERYSALSDLKRKLIDILGDL